MKKQEENSKYKKNKENTENSTTAVTGTLPYNEGVYYGTAEGYNGDITVAIVIREKTLKAVLVIEEEDDDAFFGRAMDVVTQMMKKQSTEVDTVSGATPLAALKQNGFTDSSVSVLHMFIGDIQGTIGETSALAILIGAAILLVFKVIDLKIPLTYIGSFAVFVILYMLGTGKGFDVNYLFSHIFGGGLMLGAWFMATDYVTTPITPRGQYVYGVCLGVLTAVFRLFGGSAEGVSYAIIFCNLLVPMIERVTRHPAFGKGGKKA